MAFISQYFQHRRDCRSKQDERALKISSLTAYSTPLTQTELSLAASPIASLVTSVQAGSLAPLSLLQTYGKIALRAHARTNCLTEIMLSSAESWLQTPGEINLQGPLAGIPVSLKDTINVAGYDSTAGYSSFVGNAPAEDGPIVKILKSMGAVPYVKTAVPITLLSFESTNDVWGRCTNPHGEKFSPGGSTGGEGALLAMGGRIGIGSDVAGSVRAPAAYSGIFSLRCSTGRWPKIGNFTSMPGQEGVPSVFSPMARTMDDLAYFTKAMLETQTWKWDYTVHPIPWREAVSQEYMGKKKFRVGIMRTDGVVNPSPACERGLSMVEVALKRDGHEIVEIEPPSPYEALRIGALLLNSDGMKTLSSFFRPGEWNDAGAKALKRYIDLPRPFKYLYYLWVKYVRRDEVWAGLLRDWHEKMGSENWDLVRQREAYRLEWFEWWNKADVDFLLTPAFATPAVPHDGMKSAVSACGYTFLFNVLDYTCGIIPVTHVDKVKDKLPADFKINKLNGVARGVYQLYDAAEMHGLPVAVQVVGRRLEEEKMVAVMKRVEMALGEQRYQLLDVD